MSNTTLAVIGGTGLYSLEGLSGVHEVSIATPFGEPSSPIVEGDLNGVRTLFLARHGRQHSLLPSEVNSRANIWALKKLGAEWVLSLSAVGSLREELCPGDVVVPDQLIDRTRERPATFFGGGIVAHVSFAIPFCPMLRRELLRAAYKAATATGTKVTDGGTYVCMEGPAFSTRAESHLHRSWDASLIGMTALPEAKLAREAELPYATLALVTDYDCWRTHEDGVDAASVVAVLKQNSEFAKAVVAELAPLLRNAAPSDLASRALENALLTPLSAVPPEVKERLEPIIARYLRG